MEDRTGSFVGGHYQIESLIGEGACGSVWKAKHALTMSWHAIKFLRAELVNDERTLLRFQNEARAASRLKHPYIVLVQSFGVTGQTPFIVMEYVEGKPLSERAGTLTLAEKLTVFKQLAEALSYAHAEGVVHRDLKPANVMICGGGTAVEAKVVDFGLAKKLDSTQGALTGTGEIIGSPLYMSPEQCMGKVVDSKSDIYSLGCLMYEVLSGKPPFAGQSTLQTLELHLSGKLVPLLEAAPGLVLPRGIDDIVESMLNKDPQSRPTSGAVLAQVSELDLEKTVRSTSRLPGAALLTVAAVSLLIVGSSWCIYQKQLGKKSGLADNLEPSPDARLTLNVSAKSAVTSVDSLIHRRHQTAKDTSADNEKALVFLQKWYESKAVAEGVKDPHGLMQVERHLASLYLVKDDVKSAAFYNEKALSYFVKSKQEVSNACMHVCSDLAGNYVQLQEFEKEQAILQRMETIYNSNQQQISVMFYMDCLRLKAELAAKKFELKAYEEQLKSNISFCLTYLHEHPGLEGDQDLYEHITQNMQALALLYSEQCKQDEAISSWRQLIAIEKPVAHIWRAPEREWSYHVSIAAALMAKQQYSLALEDLSTTIPEVISMLEPTSKNPAKDKPVTAGTLTDARLRAGICCLHMNDDRGAQKYFEEGCSSLVKPTPMVICAVFDNSSLLAKLGDFKQSKLLADRAVAAMEAHPECAVSTVGNACYRTANTYLDYEHVDQAVLLAEKIRLISVRKHSRTLLESFASLLRQRNHNNEALRICRLAVTIEPVGCKKMTAEELLATVDARIARSKQ